MTSHRSMWSIQERAVQNFTIHREVLQNGRYRLTIRNLAGVEIEVMEGRDRAEVDQHFCSEGYKRIPAYVANEIDSWPNMWKHYDER